jgi:hypothetical protein
MTGFTSKLKARSHHEYHADRNDFCYAVAGGIVTCINRPLRRCFVYNLLQCKPLLGEQRTTISDLP